MLTCKQSFLQMQIGIIVKTFRGTVKIHKLLIKEGEHADNLLHVACQIHMF